MARARLSKRLPKGLESTVQFLDSVAIYAAIYMPVFHQAGYTPDKAWEQVAKGVNRDVGWCKRKWARIVKGYTDYRIRKANGYVQKPYYLAPYLWFLKPYIKVQVAREPVQRQLESLKRVEEKKEEYKNVITKEDMCFLKWWVEDMLMQIHFTELCN